MTDERVHFLLFACCSLAVLGALLFLGVALWPYLAGIGTVLFTLFAWACACGGFELYSIVRHRHRMRVHELSTAEANAQRAWTHVNVIEAANLAAYLNAEGNLYNMSAFEEQAKVFPINPQEITGDLAAEIKRLHAAGESEEKLAGQFSISRYQVRRLLGKPRSAKKEEKP